MLTVFGSINLDVCVRTARLPHLGETLLGDEAQVSPGGKGANQAHAAALFGVPTRMVGMVGADPFAKPALSALVAAGVDTSGVAVDASRSTGIALITVTSEGDNAIVVASGANRSAHAGQVCDAVLRDTRVLLLQLELAPDECLRLARRAKLDGCKVILNASPIPPGWVIEAGVFDTLIVNRLELDQLCTGGSLPIDKACLVARSWSLDVLVTLGAQGSILASRGGDVSTAPASCVGVIDTTGAGDTYAGVFAAAVAKGLEAQAAMDVASAAAALACTRIGAQAAQPAREAIEAELARRSGRGPP